MRDPTRPDLTREVWPEPWKVLLDRTLVVQGELVFPRGFSGVTIVIRRREENWCFVCCEEGFTRSYACQAGGTLYLQPVLSTQGPRASQRHIKAKLLQF